jgi:hypothetical protein
MRRTRRERSRRWQTLTDTFNYTASMDDDGVVDAGDHDFWTKRRAVANPDTNWVLDVTSGATRRRRNVLQMLRILEIRLRR